jgi:ABC-type uncharacterized transport system substrate-binding protein
VDRRRFLLTSLAGAFAAPLAVEAQPRETVPRVGILPPGPISERAHLWEAFRQGLRDLGYIEGQNIILIFPSEEVTRDRLPHVASELARLKVDVLVAATTEAVQAAMKASKTIPIVAPVMADPVGAGLAVSMARPSGNVTGTSYMSSDLSGKRLELLKSIIPEVSRVAVLSSRTAPLLSLQMREMEKAARALGVRLHPVEVSGSRDLEAAFQAVLKAGASALITLDDTLIFTHRGRIVKLAEESRLPAVYGFKEFADAGGLMSYAPNLVETYRRTATYVDKILKGGRPGDLPIEQPTKFELVINLKTAKALGLTIPPSLLARADQIIE